MKEDLVKGSGAGWKEDWCLKGLQYQHDIKDHKNEPSQQQQRQ